MECFSFVRAAPPQINGDQSEDEEFIVYESEDEPFIVSELQFSGDQSEGEARLHDNVAYFEAEQTITFGLILSDDEFRDEALLHDVAEGEQSISSELQVLDEESRLEALDDVYVSEGEQLLAGELQLFGDESGGELFLNDVDEGEQPITSEFQLFGNQNEGEDEVAEEDVHRDWTFIWNLFDVEFEED